MPRALSRPLAILVSFLLAFAGLVIVAPPASAATGDVAGATLDWGVRTSFRGYITGPIAHGSWTVSGVSDASPFSWSGGSGSTNGTPSVSYPGSIHFTGHQGFGVGPDEYALDLTFSDVRVRVTGATTAELVLDARSRGLNDPSTFAELNDVVFATLDLAAGSDASTAETVAYSGVPATLTADGAVAFGDFYPEGSALDSVSFSWPVEQAPAPVVPTVSVSQTTGLVSGDTVTVTGTGFGPNAEGGPLGTRQPLSGKFGGVYVTFGTFLDAWKPSAGAPSSARKAAPGVTKWFVNAEDVATVGAAGGGVAINADGSFSLDIVVTEDFAGALADGNYGIYTYAGSGAVYAPFETYTPIAFVEPVVPTITVSQTTGLESGDTVTVTGTGFGPNAEGGPLGTRQPLSGKFGGVYATFGTFLDTWKPSAGAPSSARKAAPGVTKWFVNAEDVATVGAAGGGVAINADGSFSFDIVVTEAFAGALADGNYGIYTYAGSGAVYAPFETYTPIEFADPVPTISVSQATGLESGDTVTVTGTGFGPNAEGGPLGTRQPLSGKFGGVYVTFGTFLDTWKPSAGAPSSARKAAPGVTKWFVNAEDVATVGAAGGGVAINADGSFTLDIVVTEDFLGALADGNYGIYTYAGSGAVYAPFETYTPIAFAGPTPSISVSQTTGLVTGDTVTVTGTGFGPTADGGPLGTRQPLSGKFGGVYVTFGTFLDAWKPSAGAPSSARKAAPGVTKWFVNAEDVATVGAAGGGVAINADGSFSLDIVVTEDFAGALADGNYGIYTYAGSGAVYAPFETYTPIAFVEPVVPTITVSQTTGLESGDTVTVTGTGFGPNAEGGPLGTRQPLSGKFGGVYATFGTFLDTWKPSAGAPSSARKAAPGVTKWFVNAEDVATVGAAGGGVAINADGSFSFDIVVTEAFAGALADGNYGIYTYAGSGAVYAPFETYTPIEFADPVPTISVSQATGLESGDTVTVTGTGFGPNAEGGPLGTRQPLSGKFGGVYVTFGTFLDTWKPSAGAPSSARKAAPGVTKWFVNAEDVATVGAAGGGVAINADGSFTLDIVVTEDFLGALADGNYGIYTYAGSGAVYAPFETYTPIAFAGPTPSISVSQTTGLVTGDTVTVTGTGFGPTADGGPLGTRQPLSGKFGGVYVTFGTFLDTWKPSVGAPSSARKAAPGVTKWFVKAEDVATVGAAGGGVAINADGSFTLDIVVTEDFAGALADGNYGIYTYAGSGAVYAPFETYTPIAFAEDVPPVDPGTTLTAGSLSWGVKSSFRDYVTGPIAQGSITVGNGAGRVGSGYWFPQSAELSGSGDAVSATYRGSVTFAGHGGVLNLRLSDPVIRMTGASSAVLSLRTPSGRVDFATLALAGVFPATDTTGARTYTSVPATLTSAGAASFEGFYSAGTALDPVTFTLGSANGTSGRGGTVTAAVATTSTRTAAATPPATTGVTSETPSSGFTAGGTYTFTAEGFQPNETGILVVVYSTPTVLATDATADADGVVTWTGALPAGLTGEHTFTFQGSVDRGIVIDIAAAETIGCPVPSATLSWGFKESFRAYIDGSIAKGEWTVADGATYETPLFGWTGTGGYDADTGDADLAFAGSVRFTGHGGVLDTTIANPRVVIDGDRAVILLDITGTTQDGTPVSSLGVEFADLDLASAEQTGGGDLVAFTGIPAVLTEAGAAAFGTYEAGSDLDPVDLAITVDPTCAEPAAAVDEPVATTDAEVASDTSSIVWIVLAILAVLAAAVAVLLLVRRARKV